MEGSARQGTVVEFSYRSQQDNLKLARRFAQNRQLCLRSGKVRPIALMSDPMKFLEGRLLFDLNIALSLR